eukprot:PhM_4_TR3005/c2_g1_i3/m.37577
MEFEFCVSREALWQHSIALHYVLVNTCSLVLSENHIRHNDIQFEEEFLRTTLFEEPLKRLEIITREQTQRRNDHVQVFARQYFVDFEQQDRGTLQADEYYAVRYQALFKMIWLPQSQEVVLQHRRSVPALFCDEAMNGVFRVSIVHKEQIKRLLLLQSFSSKRIEFEEANERNRIIPVQMQQHRLVVDEADRRTCDILIPQDQAFSTLLLRYCVALRSTMITPFF